MGRISFKVYRESIFGGYRAVNQMNLQTEIGRQLCSSPGS